LRRNGSTVQTLEGNALSTMTKAPDDRTVTLDVTSRYEMLDVVHTVLLQCCAIVGFDEEAVHYMSVAVRESVVNAIKHGNRQDASKRVHVVFTLHDRALEVEVRDQGAGFDPAAVPDPLAPENLLRAYGRGLFFMRQFMDEVTHSFPPKGGTVVRMLKRVAPPDAAPA
jgi:serine/threonine-protein kinase RsbW